MADFQELEKEIELLSEQLYGKVPQSIPHIPSPIDSLKTEHQQLIKELQETVQNESWYKQMPPNRDIEKQMNDPLTFYRFAFSYEWKKDVALQKLKEMAEWRVRENIGEISLDYLKHQGPTKLMHVYGYDKLYRPIIYVNMGNLDKDPNWDSDENIELKFKYFVYSNEVAFERMAKISPNIYSTIWIIDFDDCSLGLNVLKKLNKMIEQLSEYHAERLGAVITVNTGWTFTALWSFVKLFLSESTAKKYQFVRKGDTEQLQKILSSVVDNEYLLERFGGSVPDPFDLEKVKKLEDLKKKLRDLKTSN